MLYEFENDWGSFTSTLLADYATLPAKPRRIQVPGLGDTAPDFVLNPHLFQHLDADDNPPLYSAQLLRDKPLTIAFFDPDWTENYAELFLVVLERAFPKIKALGGELLVLTSAPVLSLATLIRKTEASFGIYQDTGREIAEKYGVWSRRFPTYQRISGIEKDVVLPATFVVAQNRKIVHVAVDEAFNNPFVARDILTAIYSVK